MVELLQARRWLLIFWHENLEGENLAGYQNSNKWSLGTTCVPTCGTTVSKISGVRHNSRSTFNELNMVMKSIKNYSPGPDNIPYAFLFNVSPCQLEVLLNVYNFLWNTELQCQWRYSNIVPIRKHGKHKPTNSLMPRIM